MRNALLFCGEKQNYKMGISVTLFGEFTSSRREVFCKNGVLKNIAKFTGKHLCQRLFFNKVAGLAWNFIKKESLAQVFSCEFCEIYNNTFLYRTTPVAASVNFYRWRFFSFCTSQEVTIIRVSLEPISMYIHASSYTLLL